VAALFELWIRIEEALRAVDPTGEGLRPPASARDLEALVPPTWRPLWGRHDGQSSLLDGLFDGWFFLPLRGPVDTVASDLERLPEGWVPLAKDFGGSYLVIRPDDDVLVEWDVDEAGPTRVVAADVEELLTALAKRLEGGELPGRWARAPDGSWRPEAEAEIRVDEVEALAIGQPVPLGHGLVLVRLSLEAVPTSALPDGAHHLPFAVDAEDGDPDALGRLVGVRALRERGGAGQLAVTQMGDSYWLDLEQGPDQGVDLVLTLDLQQPITGARPLMHARSDDAIAAARAHLLLGDPEAGLARLPGDDQDGETLGLRVRLLLAAGRGDEAAARLEGTIGGGELRARALLAAGRLDEALAAADSEVERGATVPRLRLRARIREIAGDVDGARRDVEEALRSSTPSHAATAVLVADLRRLRAARRAPTAPAAPAAPEADPLPLDRVQASDQGLIVTLTPEEAARGALVLLERGGEVHGVRLPAGAGHGLAMTARLGDEPVRVEARVAMPPQWAPPPEARNASLSFDRWDVLTEVALSRDEVRDGAEIVVATPDGLRTIAWPAGADELREPGAGLPGPRGTRGDFVARCT
jgi:hypothetical protein